MNNKLSGLGTQARYLFVAKMIAFAFQLLIPVILARVFSVSNYGIYRQIILFALIFPQIFSLGIDSSIYYFYPTARDFESKKKIVSQTFLLLLLLGLIFFALYIGFHNILFSYWKNGQVLALYALPLGFYIAFALPALLLENIFIVEQRPQSVLIYNVANGLLRLILIAGVALLFEQLIVQVWILAIFELLRTVILFFYLKKRYAINILNLQWDSIKRQLGYSVPLGAGISISSFANKMEMYMMMLFLSPVQFAIYSVANFRLPFVNLVYSAVANVAMIRIAEYAQSNRNAETRLLWHKAIITQAAISFPAVFFFMALAPSFIVLFFSSKYIESIPYFRIVLLAPLAQVFSAGIILRAYNRTNYTFRINMVIFMYSVITSYFLIKYFGLFGAAICGVSTFYCTVLLEIIVASRILKLNLKQSLPFKQLFTITGISILLATPFILINYLSTTNFIKVLISSSLYFPATLYIFHRIQYINLTPVILKVKETNKKFLKFIFRLS
jgi:O-antigen/teichoic acid export membrane protein